MKLQWTDRARRDLVAIGRYIARDNPAAARRWVERLRTRAQQAATMPMAGRVVPELQRDDIREVFLRTYRIVYRIREDAIDVLTVFEGHRLFDTTDLPEFGK
jgi:toxin ParE1/3/4